MIPRGMVTRDRELLGAFLAALLMFVSACSRSEPPGKKSGETASPRATSPDQSSESPSSADPALAKGEQLYTNYCGACHGENGDGNGPAAVYLYPKPRNFHEGRFRIVTTSNRIASEEDLLHVIRRGMPGSAMFPFSQLSEDDLKALVMHVRYLTRTGIEQSLRRELAEVGSEMDSEELTADVAQLTEPASKIELPADWPASGVATVARGRELYVARGCASCHGETGKGDGGQEQRNDDGMLTQPRDFTRGIFKGGRDRAQLYARVKQGMPGTPMPSSENLTSTETADLVNFIQSLSDESARAKVEHQRVRLFVKRVEQDFPQELSKIVWDAVEATRIVVSPLWWRDYGEPDLHVQALHDGNSLALRLSWHDPTRNEHAVRPQDFDDLAAVQLFRGEREPFLGMGAAKGAVDVWMWSAGWQADLAAYTDVENVYPNMSVDMYPLETPAEDAKGHAADRQPRPFITALAAGNMRSDPNRKLAASHLQAEGFGTLTMRPPISQFVEADAKWEADRWAVVFRRPLQLESKDELQLLSGQSCSVAFALWDGDAADRDGRKLVSIWHDLELQ